MADTITLSPATATADASYTISSSLGSHHPNANVTVTSIGVPWSNTTSISNNTYTLGPNWNNGTSGKIRLEGPNADIEINGESMIDMLKNIEQRLNILRPNIELESEWEELRALGEQYRELEAKIQAKMKTWKAISK
jgi:hypothetical protein